MEAVLEYLAARDDTMEKYREVGGCVGRAVNQLGGAGGFHIGCVIVLVRVIGSVILKECCSIMSTSGGLGEGVVSTGVCSRRGRAVLGGL